MSGQSCETCHRAAPYCRCGWSKMAVLDASIGPSAWSSDPPKVPGWYWWRHVEIRQGVVVWVREDEGLMWVHVPHREPRAPEEIGGEWSGPLVPPE